MGTGHQGHGNLPASVMVESYKRAQGAATQSSEESCYASWQPPHTALGHYRANTSSESMYNSQEHGSFRAHLAGKHGQHPDVPARHSNTSAGLRRNAAVQSISSGKNGCTLGSRHLVQPGYETVTPRPKHPSSSSIDGTGASHGKMLDYARVENRTSGHSRSHVAQGGGSRAQRVSQTISVDEQRSGARSSRSGQRFSLPSAPPPTYRSTQNSHLQHPSAHNGVPRFSSSSRNVHGDHRASSRGNSGVAQSTSSGQLGRHHAAGSPPASGSHYSSLTGPPSTIATSTTAPSSIMSNMSHLSNPGNSFSSNSHPSRGTMPGELLHCDRSRSSTGSAPDHRSLGTRRAMQHRGSERSTNAAECASSSSGSVILPTRHTPS